LLGKLREEARRIGAMPPFLATTPYMNTIAPERRRRARQPRARAQDPLGDPLERGGDHPAREQGILGARRPYRELQSSALLYDIGFGHFWHAPANHGGDLSFIRARLAGHLRARASSRGA
jgi:pyruvate dehydrogenase E1 component